MSENIDTGMILEALNDKTDRDCRNVDTTSGADVVIEYQLPTAANNYTWYRLYKSGWVEQGGWLSYTSSSYVATISLIKEMKNTSYQVTRDTVMSASASPSYYYVQAIRSQNKTTTSFEIQTDIIGNGYVGCYWEAKGISAQS